MKSIGLNSWDAQTSSGTVKENIINVLSLVVNLGIEDFPKGIEQFRILRRLTEAFDAAEKNRLLELEDVDYVTLKTLLEKYIPSRLALNPNIAVAVEAFLSL